MFEGEKVLVVDDNEMVCLLLDEVLGEVGYKVTTVQNGEDALDQFRREPFPLVLLDLVLPGISGNEVLRHIKQEYPKTDVVMITSHGSMETAIEALRLGATDYLTKPFDNLDAVTGLIRKAFAKRQRIDEKEWLYKKIIEKSHQLETAVKRLESINEIGQSLHSILDLKELLHYSVDLVSKELDAERVSLMLLEKDSNLLEIKAAQGLDDQVVKLSRTKIGEGVAGWVVQKGEPLLSREGIELSNESPVDRRGYTNDTFVSTPLIISAPIKGSKEVIGVINASNKRCGEDFNADDLHFVATLASQIAIAIENALAVNRELKNTHYQAVVALAEALEAKDEVSGEHCNGMLRYAESMGQRMGLTSEEAEILRYAAVLHDIGKIGTPERILQKPASLLPEEFEVMKNHTRIGGDILKSLKFLEPVVPIIESHHEWYDGNGYPLGMAGEMIPIQARIVAVLDAFDAMTANRPYRKAMSQQEALGKLVVGAGTQFDPEVVRAFDALLKADWSQSKPG